MLVVQSRKRVMNRRSVVYSAEGSQFGFMFGPDEADSRGVVTSYFRRKASLCGQDAPHSSTSVARARNKLDCSAYNRLIRTAQVVLRTDV